jgi:pimeloyl-ACP methyl ester carboxylesterase
MSTAQIRRRKRRSNKVIQYVVAAITAMAVTNALIELAAPLSKQRLKRSRIKYVATPEGDLCTQSIGDEPIALLLHDLLPGCSTVDYEGLMTEASTTSLIAVDLLGYGRSDRPVTKYNIAMHADHVQEVLSQFPTITAIVASGYAASIAITVVNRAETTRSVTLINPEYSAQKSKQLYPIARIPVLGPFVYHIEQIIKARKLSTNGVQDDRFGNVHRTGSANVTHGPHLEDLCESIVLPVDSDVHVIHINQDDSVDGWNKVRGIVFSK